MSKPKRESQSAKLFVETLQQIADIIHQNKKDRKGPRTVAEVVEERFKHVP